MTTTARGPRTLKGALVAIGGTVGLEPVLFQYNPATMKRSLKPLMVGGEEADRSQAIRYKGAPEQTLSVDIEISAVDALEQSDSFALQYGITPQLAALELLAYPSLLTVATNTGLLAAGTIEIAPMTAPTIVFVWGAQRVLPVRINSYSISEEEFDPRLNPIQATVSLEMRVLTYTDVSSTTAEFAQFVVYQTQLTALAAVEVGLSDASAVISLAEQ